MGRMKLPKLNSLIECYNQRCHRLTPPDSRRKRLQPSLFAGKASIAVGHGGTVERESSCLIERKERVENENEVRKKMKKPMRKGKERRRRRMEGGFSVR